MTVAVVDLLETVEVDICEYPPLLNLRGRRGIVVKGLLVDEPGQGITPRAVPFAIVRATRAGHQTMMIVTAKIRIAMFQAIAVRAMG
ncbi:hypothetical protein [Sphingomonas sp. PAMC26645]|uniref:hypothetical protein n=1 Tax=Sphingomonas sp. PAMC26645 TaxID=2565555 RepID=UPI001FFA8F3D|nr:hypothetical protein [Sphingomonas sp. PAMC26645]